MLFRSPFKFKFPSSKRHLRGRRGNDPSAAVSVSGAEGEGIIAKTKTKTEKSVPQKEKIFLWDLFCGTIQQKKSIMRCGMERDEEIMMRGTKQEMPGFRFRLLRPEKKRELWNPDFELLFLLRGSGRVSYEDGEVHNLPMGSIFAINRFQICDLDLDEDGLALSLCVSAETIASFHIKLLKCEVKCQSFF